MENHQFITQAKFTNNAAGQVVAHAPQDSPIEMKVQVPQIQSINFLDLEDKSVIEDNKDVLNSEQESVFNNYSLKP
jgi:hypothetical protein